MNKQVYLLYLPILLCSIACNSNSGSDSNKTAAATADSMKASIMEKSFGNYNNVPVTEYNLTNSSGMQVSILNYGGTITKLIVPDKEGKMGDVVLGFERLSGYMIIPHLVLTGISGRSMT